MPVRLAAASNTTPTGYRPADLQSAYGLAAAAAAGGSGVTVAVIGAYDDPTAESDLALYRSQWGLPPCTSAGASPCFRKVNQRGAASPLPPIDSGWATETSLDLDMVSAICPNCSILLVEADSAFLDDLGAAVNYAVSAGAKYISNSYGSPEDRYAPTYDLDYYKHPGVVITASTGDYGYEGYQGGTGQTGNEYPSVSPWVVAVGGTTLRRAANARGWTESAWSGAGSGCSLYEARPPWQPAAATACSRRMVADVSAVADPTTGMAVVYAGSWQQVGGTSAAAPIVAAAYALAGTPAAGSWPVSYPYGAGGLNDPTGGNNAGGSCSPDPTLWCTGVAGYDGPTGLGSLQGIAPLGAPGLPGAPTGIGATVGDASARVAWSAPASNGGNAITSYTAIALPDGKRCTWTSGPLACTITGLTAGTTYAFTLRATNAVGTGPSLELASAPGQPTGVTGTRGDGRVTLTWTAPTSSGGLPITGYTATASPGGASCAWTGGPLACTVAGLTNGIAYTFSVRASNSVGTGPASVPSAPVTPSTLPGPAQSVAGTPGNASAAVTWSAPAWNGGATVTGYTATASPGGATCVWTSGPLTCTITGLANGTAYTFSVTATNVAGAGPASGPSPSVVLTPVPGAPTGVVATPAASIAGALAVTWSAPDPGDSPISSYAAFAYAPGTSTALAGCTSGTPVNAPTTQCTITGLANGVTVVVRVSATNASGQGLPSAPSAPATTLNLAAAAVVALPSWTTLPLVQVSWRATPGTYAIASYQVRYRQSSWSGPFGLPVIWKSRTTATSAAFAPAAGYTYCFSARATDQRGLTGPWSSERCTAAPLDNRSLLHSGGWASGTGSAYYRGTWTRAYAYGAKAVRASVRAKRIVLVATSCPTCGTVRVYLGSTLLRSISLYSATTINRRVFSVATFSSIRSGTVTVKLSSSRHRVIVDGLGISGM